MPVTLQSNEQSSMTKEERISQKAFEQMQDEVYEEPLKKRRESQVADITLRRQTSSFDNRTPVSTDRIALGDVTNKINEPEDPAQKSKIYHRGAMPINVDEIQKAQQDSAKLVN